MFFSRFNFALTYRPGSRNNNHGALSHQFSPSEPRTTPIPSCLPTGWWPPSLGILRVWFRKPNASIPTQVMARIINCLFLPQSTHSSCNGRRPLASPATLEPAISLLFRHFWWPSLKADTREYVAACTTCARSKASGLSLGDPAVDFVTGLPPFMGNTVIPTRLVHMRQPCVEPVAVTPVFFS